MYRDYSYMFICILCTTFWSYLSYSKTLHVFAHQGWILITIYVHNPMSHVSWLSAQFCIYMLKLCYLQRGSQITVATPSPLLLVSFGTLLVSFLKKLRKHYKLSYPCIMLTLWYCTLCRKIMKETKFFVVKTVREHVKITCILSGHACLRGWVDFLLCLKGELANFDNVILNDAPR